MKYKYIIYEKKDGYAIITFNRPERLNALGSVLLQEFRQALAGAEKDEEVGAVIVTGAGRAFCAGVDLKERAEAGDTLQLSDFGSKPVYYDVWEMRKPVIGAINGICVTGGLEVALGCDILIASENAQLGDTHARIGYIPAGGMTQFLPRRIGTSRAKEMSLTGNFISAQQAYEWGLVNHVVPADELMPLAEKIAQDIVSCKRQAMQSVKKLMNETQNLGLLQGLDTEQLWEFRWRTSTDRLMETERKPRADAAIERGRGQARARK